MRNYPDFMIIGFARCGTTTLFEHLRRHPQIFMPKYKDCPFIAGESKRSYMQRHFPKDYGDKIIGGVSTSWMFYPELFYKWFFNNTKIIIITRNQDTRAKSLWQFLFDRGDEERSWDRCEDEYFELSNYTEYISNWNFEKDDFKIYLTALETLSAKDWKVMDEIYEFLGVMPYRARTLGRRYNIGTNRMNKTMQFLRKSWIRHLIPRFIKQEIWQWLQKK